MKQYITLLFCFFTIFSFAQDKTVHLVHGLGGDDESWSEFESIIQEECPGTKTSTFFNPSNAGLDFYSQGLRKDFKDYGINEIDIAIGHSFGGLSLRDLDNEGYFGGYMTVGTVHDGSPLADSNLDGSFDAWIDNTCKEVITEPITAMNRLNLLYIAPGLLNGFFEDLFCNKILDALRDKAEPFVGGGESVRDLIDDGYAANLPAASIPGIGIVCTTKGHPFWDLLDGGDLISLPGNMTVEVAATQVELIAKSSSRTLHILSTITFNPILKTRLRNASKEFKDSYLWMQSTEAAWNELIGAGGGVDWVEQENSYWDCDCIDINTSQPVPCTNLGSSDDIEINDIGPDFTCNPDSDCWVTTTNIIPVFGEDLPSDGLIPLNRQYLPGSIYDELVTDVSHFEQPGNQGVQNLILSKFRSQLILDNSFKISNCL